MELSKQVTSLELSKRLEKLGVKQESLYSWIHWANATVSGPSIVLSTDEMCYGERAKVSAAFTVAELGEMLPRMIYDPETKRPQWLGMTNGQPTMERWYVHYEPLYETTYKFCTEGDTEAEARGLMLEYLITSKLMSV